MKPSATHVIKTLDGSTFLHLGKYIHPPGSEVFQTFRRTFKKSFQRAAVACAVTLSTLVATAAGAYLFIQSNGNFHAVEPATVYRSAQLDSQALQEVIHRHGIRSVLNLRGHNPGKDWYDAEVATSTARGVQHFNYGLSANASPGMEQMRAILKIIKDAPKPILIHCKAGADRTGLVSALYLAAKGRSPDEVRDQLALRFGHAPFGTWSRTRAMDESLERFLNSPP